MAAVIQPRAGPQLINMKCRVERRVMTTPLLTLSDGFDVVALQIANAEPGAR
jgi:hypothetical protein